MDYKETLNLPVTDFPMRANLPQREPEILDRWNRLELDRLVSAPQTNKPNFTLHDGPPYANGHIHIGHALNKILKDIVIKSKRMQGYYAPYVPGWDCHGLPIELKVDQKLGNQKREMSKVDIRKECRLYAEEWVGIQRDEFKRLGIFGDWNHPYLTMTSNYEAATARELARFAERGALYKGKKPIHWCSSCVTALAEAEVEYDNHTSPSIFVKFQYQDELPDGLEELNNKPLYFVIWTTTPWTIPANLAICLHPELTYAAVDIGNERLVIAEALVDQVMQTLEISAYQTVKTFSAGGFENRNCSHPLYSRNSLIVLGDHVTLEAGTGCVHTAPGHGQDDYLIGLKYGLEVYNPVDDYGRYQSDLEFFGGEKVPAVNDKVSAKLNEVGALLNQSKVTHSYPHCWRCKKPIIFRATEQWFISMEANNLRNKALNHINEVEWIPHWGRERIYNMIENRPDWCVSRQRSWGVPITVFYCDKCNESLADGHIMHHVANLFEETGSDVWFEKDASSLLPSGTICASCGHKNFRKEMDILDVWFDSGVSFAAVVEKLDQLDSPADLYLEGSDQHRGWFHSSLLAAVGTRDRAPYKAVLTHGFVLDEKGRPMSKSEGNVVAPEKVIQKYGAEILRLWVATQDYRNDTRVGEAILKQVSEAYRRIRNTARYILGNLHDFQPLVDSVDVADLIEIDRWAISRLEKLRRRVLGAYRTYEFHVFYHALHNFCAVDMSAFYLDVLKDRLYTSPAKSLERRSAQTTIYRILDTLTRLMAPVLSFTAEEIWSYLPGDREQSVHLADFPEANDKLIDSQLEEKYDQLLSIRGDVAKVLEKARAEKLIGHSLDAQVKLSATGELADLLQNEADQLSSLFIVSQVNLHSDLSDGVVGEANPTLRIQINRAKGQKCNRCWNYATTVGDSESHPEICHRCENVLTN
ncbi:MAG: isoleucine--tRNA ligase [Deltaproteobacteria bacterium]|jgi:isoleucyl-tRNA synthetase|nr:isoleucine--tRNA ligase [Deltaproteobacteria bacterium]